MKQKVIDTSYYIRSSSFGSTPSSRPIRSLNLFFFPRFQGKNY